jgi:hypothetical protein
MSKFWEGLGEVLGSMAEGMEKAREKAEAEDANIRRLEQELNQAKLDRYGYVPDKTESTIVNGVVLKPGEELIYHKKDSFGERIEVAYIGIGGKRMIRKTKTDSFGSRVTTEEA